MKLTNEMHEIIFEITMDYIVFQEGFKERYKFNPELADIRQWQIQERKKLEDRYEVKLKGN